MNIFKHFAQPWLGSFIYSRTSIAVTSYFPFFIVSLVLLNNGQTTKFNLLRWGHEDGASGRAVAFCPSRLGSNPRTDFFLVQSCCESILAGRWAFF